MEKANRFHQVSWLLCILCFGLGFWIGMNTDARVGIGLWFASVVFALIPFASHRHRV